MTLTLCRTRAQLPSHRRLSTLPYRIRVPLAKLQAAKALPREAARPGALGDGEALEGAEVAPDYVRMALTSRVYDYLTATPLVHAGALSERLQSVIHLKREDLNPSYSFYVRCAYAKLAELKAQGCSDVFTVSIGSRGHAIACAAERLGIAATIVMPEGTPESRGRLIQRKGQTVVLHGATMSDAQQEAQRLSDASGGALLQAHDDPLIIAGSATCGIEITRQHGAAVAAALGRGGQIVPAGASPAPSLDAVFVPVGGGSLLAGVASAVKQISPSTKVIAVEPKGVDVMRQSLLSGHCVSIDEPGVDGIWVRKLGPEVFRVCDELVDDVVVVSDAEIAQAIRDTFEDTRALLEPAGAISVAGLVKWKEARKLSGECRSGTQGGRYVAIASDACNIEFDLIKEFASGASIVRISGDANDHLK